MFRDGNEEILTNGCFVISNEDGMIYKYFELNSVAYIICVDNNTLPIPVESIADDNELLDFEIITLESVE